MNQGLFRWVDKNIGRPLCFLLTLHRKLCDVFKTGAADYGRPSKILFIKLIEQGSTVLTYPALKKGADLAGRENLFFLVFRENRNILDILDVVPPSNIIEIDSQGFKRFICSSFKALAKIRKEKIDACLDMEFFSRGSGILSYLSGADKRVGFHQFSCEGPYRGDLFTHRLIYNPYLHTRLIFASLVEALNHRPPSDGSPVIFEIPSSHNGGGRTGGAFPPRREEARSRVIPSPLREGERAARHLPAGQAQTGRGEGDEPPRFSASEDEEKAMIEKLENLKGAALSKPIIVLNPNIGDLLPIRRWPEENFVKLGRMISEGFPQATIVITGTAQEKKEGERIASQIGGAVSLAGHTSLRELLTLYCIADCLVTNDSGPAHFSTLTPIKSIVLFGPETPILYGGMDEDSQVLAPGLVCSPCVNVYNYRKSPCKIGTCLKEIKAEDVLTLLRTRIGSGKEPI